MSRTPLGHVPDICTCRRLGGRLALSLCRRLPRLHRRSGGRLRRHRRPRLPQVQPARVCVHHRPASTEAAARASADGRGASADVDGVRVVERDVPVPAALDEHMRPGKVARSLKPLSVAGVHLHELPPLVAAQEADRLLVCPQGHVGVREVDEKVEVQISAHHGRNGVEHRQDHCESAPLNKPARREEPNVRVVLGEIRELRVDGRVRLEVHVHQVEVRRVMQREQQPRGDHSARRTGDADEVDDARVVGLGTLADGDAIERIDVEVRRQSPLLLPDGALEARLAALGEGAHVERCVRHVAPLVIEHRGVGIGGEGGSGCVGLDSAIHSRVRRREGAGDGAAARRGDGCQHQESRVF
mmetsp:Transcript_22981/g.73568  ORF Transcript_22981/g.73568 Transcript_22981/m.73568 type:complete len:357 (-) Transcript_22981:3-1073(-)